jgi:hypothetical protein
MKRFGENPFSESLYRVVFSDSRTDLLGGKWPDGDCAYREVPRYPGIRGQWILEKWCSPAEYAGTPEQYTREQWDAESGLLTCGPYPHRGEYAHCYTFPFMPGDGMICQVIGALKVSRDLTAAQHKQGIMEPLERQQKQQDQRFDDIFKEAMGPFSKADAVVSMASRPNDRAGWKRGGDMPVQRFDQSAPLPTRDNFFGTIQNKQTIAALTGE